MIFALSVVDASAAQFRQTCQTGSIVASTPTSRFTDNNDGTVTDTVTGLMWKKCSEGQTYDSTSGGCDGTATTYTWQGALQQAAAVRTSGYAGDNDWRLPNIKELASIVERQCVDPAVNLAVFPATPPDDFWSSSTYAGFSAGADYIMFSDGQEFVGQQGQSGTTYYSGPYDVRLVRGGQTVVGGSNGSGNGTGL
jgi:hypothetical protein